MKPLTAEWVQKAEGDFASAGRERRARKSPNYDGLCFNAQQCVEKYLKARLCEEGIEFRKTHDLVALLDQLLAVEPTWEYMREDLSYLSDFAVMFRYPGEFASREYGISAYQRCKRIRSTVRESLGLHES